MDQKASEDLAPRKLRGNVYTAQNEMETWHLPEELAVLTTAKKGALVSSLCDSKGQNS